MYNVVDVAGNLWCLRDDEVFLVEEHLPLTVVVSLVLVGDVVDDSAPYQMICCLCVWTLEVVAVIEIEHEAISLVTQNQKRGIQRREERTCMS